MCDPGLPDVKKCGSSGFQLYSVQPGAKPEILDYGATCIRFVLNQKNCIGELDKTNFVTTSAFCLFKNLKKNLNYFIALAMAFWKSYSCENTNIILLYSLNASTKSCLTAVH